MYVGYGQIADLAPVRSERSPQAIPFVLDQSSLDRRDVSPTGLIYDIQGYSVHDGPGIRTSVFLKGCPLSCPWCHSPESQAFHAQVCYKKSSCIGSDACARCIEACPNGAIERVEDERFSVSSEAMEKVFRISIDRARCDDCGKCASACPSSALYVCGKRFSIDEVLARVLKDRHFYEASGGGVTLSGGEPLSQADFAIGFLKACKEEGLHTALDTTGFAHPDSVSAVAAFTDLFLLDLKHMDSSVLEKVVGVGNDLILRNAAVMADSDAKIQVRIPVIPRFNDSLDNMGRTAEFCSTLGSSLSCVQLLPYHTLGLAKHERLQSKDKVFAATPMSDEDVEVFKDPFISRGIDVIVH